MEKIQSTLPTGAPIGQPHSLVSGAQASGAGTFAAVFAMMAIGNGDVDEAGELHQGQPLMHDEGLFEQEVKGSPSDLMLSLEGQQPDNMPTQAEGGIEMPQHHVVSALQSGQDLLLMIQAMPVMAKSLHTEKPQKDGVVAAKTLEEVFALSLMNHPSGGLDAADMDALLVNRSDEIVKSGEKGMDQNLIVILSPEQISSDGFVDEASHSLFFPVNLDQGWDGQTPKSGWIINMLVQQISGQKIEAVGTDENNVNKSIDAVPDIAATQAIELQSQKQVSQEFAIPIGSSPDMVTLTFQMIDPASQKVMATGGVDLVPEAKSLELSPLGLKLEGKVAENHGAVVMVSFTTPTSTKSIKANKPVVVEIVNNEEVSIQLSPNQHKPMGSFHHDGQNDAAIIASPSSKPVGLPDDVSSSLLAKQTKVQKSPIGSVVGSDRPVTDMRSDQVGAQSTARTVASELAQHNHPTPGETAKPATQLAQGPHVREAMPAQSQGNAEGQKTILTNQQPNAPVLTDDVVVDETSLEPAFPDDIVPSKNKRDVLGTAALKDTGEPKASVKTSDMLSMSALSKKDEALSQQSVQMSAMASSLNTNQMQSRASVQQERFILSQDADGGASALASTQTGQSNSGDVGAQAGSTSTVPLSVDVGRRSWPEQLAQFLARQHASLGGVGQTSLQLQLHPQTLGRIQLTIMRSEEGIRVRLATESKATAILLGEGEGRLQSALEGQGLRMLSFQASSGGQSFGQQSHEQSSSDASPGSGGRSEADRFSDEDSMKNSDQALEQETRNLLDITV